MSPAPSDRELWEASCLTRYQLEHWTDADLAAHAEGIRHTIRHTIRHLLSLLGDGARVPTPGGDGRHCTHHDDDPAHGMRCYPEPEASKE